MTISEYDVTHIAALRIKKEMIVHTFSDLLEVDECLYLLSCHFLLSLHTNIGKFYFPKIMTRKERFNVSIFLCKKQYV